MSKNFIQDLLTQIAQRGRSIIGIGATASYEGTEDLGHLSRALLAGRGEASGVAMARHILDIYHHAPTEQRLTFLKKLAQDFGPDEARLARAIEAYTSQKNQKSLAELSRAAEPARQELLRRLNAAPGGTAALVRMREDVLKHLKTSEDLSVLDEDFLHLFSSWFNRGFLVLRRIDWTTPANILAKIIQYEAVHSIRSWDDLRNRLEPSDRRCFAFFHPQLVDEPLVFVEVALTPDIPDAIAPLLNIERDILADWQASVAVFYSISNCQTGLRGVSFGNFLIKQVVEELKRDLPGLKTFVTLSPVPGFMGWLKTELTKEKHGLLPADVAAALKPLLSDKLPDMDTLGPAQLSAAAVYFLHAKANGDKPADPVARFHLGNGARLERINFKADMSANGLRQSAGLMVNYLYDLTRIEVNHEAYFSQSKIAASPAVHKLLPPAPSKAASVKPAPSLPRKVS